MAETNHLDGGTLGRPRRRRKSRHGLSKAGMYTIILGSTVAALGVVVAVLLLQAPSTSTLRPLTPAVRPQAVPTSARPQPPVARSETPATRRQVIDPAPAVPDSWRWNPPPE